MVFNGFFLENSRISSLICLVLGFISNMQKWWHLRVFQGLSPCNQIHCLVGPVSHSNFTIFQVCFKDVQTVFYVPFSISVSRFFMSFVLYPFWWVLSSPGTAPPTKHFQLASSWLSGDQVCTRFHYKEWRFLIYCLWKLKIISRCQSNKITCILRVFYMHI